MYSEQLPNRRKSLGHLLGKIVRGLIGAAVGLFIAKAMRGE